MVKGRGLRKSVTLQLILLELKQYIAKSLKPPTQYGKTTKQEINNPSEVPEQWELGKSYEADWATNITHWQIKEFCRHLCNEKKDQWQNDAPYLLPLYQNFIKDRGIDSPCIPALYEKLCYIRDRIIYRPSYEPMSSGEIVQTSAQLGQEVQSLPNAAYLYQAILDVYQGLISCMKSEMQNCQHGIYIAMLTEMWVGRVNEGDLSPATLDRINCISEECKSPIKYWDSNDLEIYLKRYPQIYARYFGF